MLLFRFERGLFRFSAAGPALLPLFQLPPTIGERAMRPPVNLLDGLNPSAHHFANFRNMALPDLVATHVDVT